MEKKKGAFIDTIITSMVAFLAIPGYVNCPELASIESGSKDRNFGGWEDPQLIAEELRVAFRSQC